LFAVPSLTLSFKRFNAIIVNIIPILLNVGVVLWGVISGGMDAVVDRYDV